MLFVAFSFLAIIHTIPWIVRGAELPRDPVKICFALSAVTILPYYLLIASGYRSDVLLRLSGDSLDRNLAWFSVLYSFGMALLWLGIALGRSLPVRWKRIPQKPSSRALLVSIGVLLFLYGLAFFAKIEGSGGLVFLLNNIERRTHIVSSAGALSVLVEPTVFVSTFLLIYSYALYRKPNFLIVVGVITVLFLSLAVFGGRKLPMFMLIFASFAYHVYVRPVRILSLGTLTIGSTLFLFFVGMLQFRGSIDLSLLSPLQVLATAVRNLSYIDTYAFILDHFGSNEFWYGAAFGDLLVRSGISGPDIRVPIDDGVYVRTLFQGWSVFPPTPFEGMFASSWPPESFGNGYLNFGAIGVFTFFFLRGLLVGIFFLICRQSNYAPAMYFLFLFVAFNFHLTNLRIVQFALVAIPVYFLHLSVSRLARVRFR